ncbi:hypothetical protein [Streptomyces sp. Amel2xC10]|uniref:hypothetical protein n=1 Tax=Streptomyces sp. Amel2xC10 TaxID=1305826 RepID=UPI000A08A209|nr:hypothetical protein [Streptomyces sp. Amel2xC10]SMF85893.1 hypothetical protein SAMN02745830_07075 [Streptomyces sp. Amel2xC10]
MTAVQRRRFSVRLGIADNADGTLYEGVPDHLLRPLQQWVYEWAKGAEGYIGEIVCLRLRITVPEKTNAAWCLSQQKDMALLDAVDELLAIPFELGLASQTKVYPLSLLLENAGSAYRVADNSGGLELRVTPGVSEALRQTVDDAAAANSVGSAADHLTAAWQAAYRLHPDPVRAYSEAIKAVECAAHSVIQPNHARATLGTMLGEIGNARAKFRTAVSTPAGGDPIAPVEAMMRALWDGQTSRHGKQTATVPETLEAARAGVHLAAALVQWFASGVVIRTP